MSSKYHKFIKPSKSLAAIYVVTCGAALFSSAILLHMNRVRTPQFCYLLPLALGLLWSLYFFLTGKSTTIELLERVDRSTPISTPSTRLQFLRELRDTGRLTEAEYQEQRHRILENLHNSELPIL